ncbi:MAG TPA: LON peptidase substrate-binding domain-containing protein [Labilithrix sp.]|nr:LON peptidase substrate-binding domain-containing protein [Labilithrix sp.]
MTRPFASPFDDVPVFPLPETVLFPDARMPLHVFEPRYRAMLADCLESGGAIVIASVNRSGSIAKIAGLGMIVEHRSLPDGRSNIVVMGAERVRLDELVPEEPPRYPYKRARITRLGQLDVTVSAADRTALLATATMFASEVRKHDPSFVLRMQADAPAGAIADACAFQLVVDPGLKQSLLEELDPRVRVRIVMDQLAIQHGAMQGDSRAKVLH